MSKELDELVKMLSKTGIPTFEMLELQNTFNEKTRKIAEKDAREHKDFKTKLIVKLLKDSIEYLDMIEKGEIK